MNHRKQGVKFRVLIIDLYLFAMIPSFILMHGLIHIINVIVKVYRFYR